MWTVAAMKRTVDMIVADRSWRKRPLHIVEHNFNRVDKLPPWRMTAVDGLRGVSQREAIVGLAS
jgi:hypothetical protein